MAVNVDNVGVDVTVELGRRTVTVDEARAVQVGDTIAFDRLAGESFDVLVNGRAFGQGETVVIADLMALRLTRLYDYETTS